MTRPCLWTIATTLFLVAIAGCSEPPEQRRKRELFESYKMNAEKGDPVSQYKLGVCFLSGEGTAQDFTQAAQWKAKAAAQGYFGEEIGKIIVLAEGGNVSAQYKLGRKFVEGTELPRNNDVALKWLRRAANQGSAEAQVVLGYMYAEGRGLPQDEAEAIRWWRKAASIGTDAWAPGIGMVFYGKVPEYFAGRREQYVAELNKRTAEAVRRHVAWAHYTTGLRYENSFGVTLNQTEAVRLFRLSADAGNAAAQYHLGLKYAKADGVAQDHVEAAKWYLKAAHQGHAGAQIGLADAFYGGIGVPIDLAEAFVWYDLASHVHEPSKIRRNELAATLSSEVVKREQVRSSVLLRQIQEKVLSDGERPY
jgi:TPR repeat protein